MAVKERLWIGGAAYGPDTTLIDSETGKEVGKVSIEVINGNVVVTVERVDEAKFGPVSVVVV